MVEEQVKKFGEATKPVDEKLAKELINVVTKALENGDLELSSPIGASTALATDKTNVVEYNASSTYGVSLFHNNIDKNEFTIITVILDKDKNILRHQEIKAAKDANDNVTYEHFVENEKVSAGSLNTSSLERKAEIQPASWLGCMNDCLASQGVPGWLIGVFMILCAGVCGTGILCVACLEGPLLAYALQFNYCWNRC